MRVSYDEGVASHIGPESCGRIREGTREALTGERAGWVLSPEILIVRDADALMSRGRRCRAIRQREGRSGPAGSKTPCMHGSISQRRAKPCPQGRPKGDPSLPFGSREVPGSAAAVAAVRADNPQGALRR